MTKEKLKIMLKEIKKDEEKADRIRQRKMFNYRCRYEGLPNKRAQQGISSLHDERTGRIYK